MAKAPESEAAEGTAPAPKSSKMMIIVIVLIMALLIAIAAVGMLLLKSKHAGTAEDEEVAEDTGAKKKGEPGKPPGFVPVDAFTVNLVQEQGEQFLQIVLSLRIADAHEDALIKNMMPQIRNDILRVLSSKKASELITVEGKDKLAQELKDTVNAVIDPPEKGQKPEGPVEAVLFTSFIIQ